MGKKITVRLTLSEEMLGTSNNNPDIHREYIASKSPDHSTIEDEVAAAGVESVVENAMTVFPKMADGTPFVYDYQIRGYFKEACKALKRTPGTKSSKVKAYKQYIDNGIFVEPRQIVLDMHGGLIDSCQRPLRASTPQGERVALANSETVPEGTTLEFAVICFVDEEAALIKEWLGYGRYKGLGQWRNSGKGKFTAEILSEENYDPLAI